MSTHCQYVRKNQTRDGYEYGHIKIDNHASANEKRIYVPLGEVATIDEALRINEMALHGEPNRGASFTQFKWRHL